MFKKCTFETNVIMGTSVNVDEEGNTFSVLPKRNSEDELLYENFEDKPTEKKSKEESKKEKEEPKKKSKRVTGLVKLCREMKSAGASEEEIRKAVAQKYIGAGKSKKDAEGRAKNWVKNMVWN